jgi:hypothetical protein
MIKQSDKKVSRKVQDKQTYWIIMGMIALIVVVLLVFYLRQASYKFEYNTLSFTVEQSGGTTFYHYYHNFEENNQIIQANTYLRIDPRKNDVPADINIYFPANMNVYISVNQTGLENCSDGAVAVATLTQFFATHLMKVRGATPDLNESVEKNMRFANCTSNPENPVVLIEKADDTKITREKNCYIIDVSQCEIQKAIEKFEIKALLDAKNSN